MREYALNPSDTAVMEAAAFLHGELPIRLARQVVSLDQLPYGMCLMPSVRQVRNWYVQSYRDIVDGPEPLTLEAASNFTTTLSGIYERHAKTLATMSRGTYELRQELTRLFDDDPDASLDAAQLDFSTFFAIHDFLDSFYSSRIGIRTLIAHHLEVHRPDAAEQRARGIMGIIDDHTDPSVVADVAAVDAQNVCERSYGRAPEVHVESADPAIFTFIPSHLHYILFELLKNALRATMDKAQADGNGGDMPPVTVTIANSRENESVCIRISDRGGGIPFSVMPRIFSYLYTTATLDQGDLMHDDFSGQAPAVAGYGYGLPIARQFARYFGGDLRVESLEGIGTEAYVYLKRLNKREVVP